MDQAPRISFLRIACSLRPERLRLRIERLALWRLAVDCNEAFHVQRLPRLPNGLDPAPNGASVTPLSKGALLLAHKLPLGVLHDVCLRAARSTPSAPSQRP